MFFPLSFPDPCFAPETGRMARPLCQWCEGPAKRAGDHDRGTFPAPFHADRRRTFKGGHGDKRDGERNDRPHAGNCQGLQTVGGLRELSQAPGIRGSGGARVRSKSAHQKWASANKDGGPKKMPICLAFHRVGAYNGGSEINEGRAEGTAIPHAPMREKRPPTQ